MKPLIQRKEWRSWCRWTRDTVSALTPVVLPRGNQQGGSGRRSLSPQTLLCTSRLGKWTLTWTDIPGSGDIPRSQAGRLSGPGPLDTRTLLRSSWNPQILGLKMPCTPCLHSRKRIEDLGEKTEPLLMYVLVTCLYYGPQSY